MDDAISTRTLVASLIKGWETKDVAAICACLAEDAVWHNMPHAPIRGRDIVGSAIGKFLESVDTVIFHVHNQGQIGEGLFVNERTDSFRMADGREMHLPVMGIFVVRNGLIHAWRDYFDGAATNI